MGICMNAKEIKDKFRKYFMVVLLVFCSAFVVTNYKTTTVQAASTSTMKKAYTNYVRKNRWFIKGYSIVNIGPSNMPVLLTVTGSDVKQGSVYYSCDIYYYIGGRVTYMNSYGGGRPLTLYKRNGKYYLWNGNSSDKIYACIRGNKLCVVTCRDSKERYYSTTAEKYAYGRTVYKTYTMSKSNYVKTTHKYKYCKRIKFQKVR